tara:strand:- start:27942 stop:28112 length:171 start_codon:yes stop_codon:yes gene_type:complete
MNKPNEENADETRDRRTRQKRIGNQLRRLYDEVATEPVPDDFMKLLDQADKNKKQK